MEVQVCVPWCLQELRARRLSVVLWGNAAEMVPGAPVSWAKEFHSVSGCAYGSSSAGLLQEHREAVSAPSHISCAVMQVPDLWTQGTAPLHCKNVDFSPRAFYLCLCCLVNWAGMKWHRLK